MTDSTCMCSFDRETEDAWPCYPRSYWKTETCEHCDNKGHCYLKAEGREVTNTPCLCQNIEPFCTRYKMDDKILKLWEYYGAIVPTVPAKINSDDEIIEALGFKVRKKF